MKIAALADVHGNIPALEAVLADAARQDVDAFIVAGDVTSGPEPQTAVDSVRGLKGWVIRGNHEAYYLDYHRGAMPHGPAESKQWAPMRWAYEQLTPATLAYLAALPQQRVVTPAPGAPIHVVHGSPHSDRESLYPDRVPAALHTHALAGTLPPKDEVPPLDERIAGVEAPVLICAHTHIPWVQRANGCLVVNTGSAGMSLTGDPRAHYALLTWTDAAWAVAHRAVDYDRAEFRRRCEVSGFLEEGGAFARAWVLSNATARNVAGRFNAHARRVAEAAGCDVAKGIPDDLWDRAAALFDWERLSPRSSLRE
jgi:predicted phosphodiesterase